MQVSFKNPHIIVSMQIEENKKFQWTIYFHYLRKFLSEIFNNIYRFCLAQERAPQIDAVLVEFRVQASPFVVTSNQSASVCYQKIP